MTNIIKNNKTQDIKSYKQQWYNKNLKIIKKRKKEYYLKNKDLIRQQQKEYRINNKDIINKKRKENILKNGKNIKLYHKQYDKEYRLKNKEILNKKKKEYLKNKYQKNPSFRIKCNLRRRIHNTLKNNKKSTNSINLLGCDIDFARKYIESQFKEGMTWDNHGKFGWHIDHIIPCASFDLSDPEQQKICFHYTNLQPLWWMENLKKSNKVIIE
jgi:hypothetical protein